MDGINTVCLVLVLVIVHFKANSAHGIKLIFDMAICVDNIVGIDKRQPVAVGNAQLLASSNVSGCVIDDDLAQQISPPHHVLVLPRVVEHGAEAEHDGLGHGWRRLACSRTICARVCRSRHGRLRIRILRLVRTSRVIARGQGPVVCVMEKLRLLDVQLVLCRV